MNTDNQIQYGRKRSGIVKELRAKIDSWIKTIDDEAVQDTIKKNAIITGGSIASMLLGEKVNDFDIYMRTKESTLLVAQYYVQKFNEKKANDSTNSIGYTPYVKEELIVNAKGQTEERVLIWMQSAGVAAEEQASYQYFEGSPEEFTHEFAESLTAAMQRDKEAADYRPTFLSENAITLTGSIQVVIRFYGEPEQIHDNYDFVHAMNYYDYAAKSLVLKQEALESLMSRTLIYRGSLYPICSLYRIRKFLDRGWRISAGQITKIAWQISELDLTDKNVIREQLTGCDMAYQYQLIQALEDVDAEKIDSAYICAIIDRIYQEN